MVENDRNVLKSRDFLLLHLIEFFVYLDIVQLVCYQLQASVVYR